MKALLLIGLLALLVACSPAKEMAPEGEIPPAGDDVPTEAVPEVEPEQEAEDLDLGLEEVGTLEEDLDLSELDDLDAELENFDW